MIGHARNPFVVFLTILFLLGGAGAVSAVEYPIPASCTGENVRLREAPSTEAKIVEARLLFGKPTKENKNRNRWAVGLEPHPPIDFHTRSAIPPSSSLSGRPPAGCSNPGRIPRGGAAPPLHSSP